jgi:gliding motility-associated-like protein
MLTTKSGIENSFTVNGDNTIIKGTDFLPVPGTGGAYLSSRVDLSNFITVGTATTVSNSSGKFSLGFINGGVNDGTMYGFFSDFKSSNVQTSEVSVCHPDSVQLSAYGGVLYHWSPAAGLSNTEIANPKASPATATNYKVIITSSDGCVDSAFVNVKVFNVIKTETTASICQGTVYTFPSGKTANTAGDYTDTIRYSSGCDSLVTTVHLQVGSVTPSVSIVASANTICAGTPVTFTATPGSGIPNPTYQWLVNGAKAGTNNTTFSSSTLANDDVVSCVLSVTAPCATAPNATSNSIIMVVNPNLKPSVSITASLDNICSTTPVTFTATPVDPGTAPIYQWLLNGNNVGDNNPVYINSNLTNGDKVSCVMTVNDPCTTPNVSASNTISITVTLLVTPSASIGASETTVCAGTPVTFTATPVNGGNEPVYQWMVNGNNTGQNSSTFTSTTLNNGDVVSCDVANNAACAIFIHSVTNVITVKINPLPVANAGGDKTIAQGNTITLNATASGNIADITWSPTSGLDNNKILTPKANPAFTTTYTLTLTTTDGCIAADSATVNVLVEISIPNTFTPNGDDVNDKWEIKNLQAYQNCSVQIFNRWGQQVYSSRGYGKPWDGTYNGKPLPFGTYYYVINLKDGSKPYGGFVTILR